MNEQSEFLTLSGNLFTFTNFRSKCLVDVFHTEEGIEMKLLKIKSDPLKPIRFAYTSERGMVRINSKGSTTNEAVLDELLSLKDGDCDGLINYFEKYGFIIPISQKSYDSFKFEDLFVIIRRLQYTIKLMAKIQDPELDYMSILYLVSYLLLSNPVTINTKETESYDTCIHRYTKLIMDTDFSKEIEISELPGIDVDYTDKYYLIPDSITGCNYKLNLIDYYPRFDDVHPVTNEPLYKGCLNFLEIMYLFRNAQNIHSKVRQIVEFFFHLQNDISPIKEIGPNGHFVLSRDDAANNFDKHFTDNMKNALIDIAKTVIKEEIDHAISAITPDYNTDTMSASWFIPDYIAGIYFSIFYMNSNLTIYRQCENPACIKYFMVSTTNSRKRYCCDNCRNSASQRRYRKKNQTK